MLYQYGICNFFNHLKRFNIMERAEVQTFTREIRVGLHSPLQKQLRQLRKLRNYIFKPWVPL